jgi:FlaG/FlaF family flagellin (archaellin)
MKKIAISLALAAILAVAHTGSFAVQAAAAETQVTAAAAGVFPPDTTFSGIPLEGSTFGVGVVVYADGTATGDFAILLTGTSVLAEPQNISLEGKVSAGSVKVDGSVSLSGTGTLDMGDGSLPASVPFSVVVTTGGLQLTIGASVLPTQTLSAGSIFIG